MTDRPTGDDDRLGAATVTVVVPTWNRVDLLVETLASVLAQDTPSMVVLVHDNASTDDTAARVAAIDDERLVYRANETNLGYFRNWKRAVDAVQSPYVAVIQDDDRWRPGFLTAGVAALDASPEAAFAFSDIEFIDEGGTVLDTRPVGLAAGPSSGLDYLEAVVRGDNVVVDSSAAVMRTGVLRAAGGFDYPHMTHDIVFDYQFRMCAIGDLVRIPEPLTQVRLHSGQIHHATVGGVSAIGMVAERMDAAALLLGSARAADPAYRAWLSDRLMMLGRLRSQYTADVVPQLTAPADDRLSQAVDDILDAVPPGAAVSLAGDDLLYDERLRAARTVRPFPELDGHCAGPPTDSARANEELDRHIGDGVEFVAVPWPSLWWLDHYHGWRDHLAARSPSGGPIVDTSRVVIYRVGPES